MPVCGACPPQTVFILHDDFFPHVPTVSQLLQASGPHFPNIVFIAGASCSRAFLTALQPPLLAGVSLRKTCQLLGSVRQHWIPSISPTALGILI